MSLKDNLREYREKAGYNQAKEFAKAAGIPYSSYSSYENGSWPNETNLIKIAATLHISIDTLLNYDPEQPDEIEKIIQDLGGAGFGIIKDPHPSLFQDDPHLENLGPEYEIYYEDSEFPIIVHEKELKALYWNYLNASSLKEKLKAAKKAAFTEVLLDYLNTGRKRKITTLPKIK